MRLKLVTTVGALLLLVAMMAVWWGTHDVRGQDRPSPPRVEYKVVFYPVESVTITESVRVDGKLTEVSHGPKASAEEMTKQCNALAAEGWEYVGPVASTGSIAVAERPVRAAEIGGASGVLVVFKKAK